MKPLGRRSHERGWMNSRDPQGTVMTAWVVMSLAACFTACTRDRQTIDHEITDGHAIVTADIDGDGRDEVIVGQRGGARSLMLYAASADGASWTTIGSMSTTIAATASTSLVVTSHQKRSLPKPGRVVCGPPTARWTRVFESSLAI